MAEDIDRWKNRWETKNTGWHENKTNLNLIYYHDQILNGREASQVKILVPLCGKTVDMKWLYDQGHHVVGIEAVAQPVEEFFAEHSIDYSKRYDTNVVGNDVVVYESNDSRIKILVCDLFSIDVRCTGKMDACWDRGSMVAIEPSLRPRYSKTIQSLMSPGHTHLVECMTYNKEERSGPPHSIDLDEIKELFSSFQVINLTASDFNVKMPHWAHDLSYFNRLTVLIK